MALLELRDLRVAFRTRDGLVRAVNDVSLSLDRGQTLGLVGESGSGKTVTALTILGLTRSERTEIAGEALLDGNDLLSFDATELRSVRGRRIAMVFQDPLSSLHPMYRVGWQIVEAIRAHERVSKKAARGRAVDLLRSVGIPSPATRLDAYPHELSGGMRQRVMIAIALALGPDLLIADEPTSALDVTVQSQILELLGRLQSETGMALLLVSHDLGVIAEQADEIAVMYAGRIVEHGPSDRRDRNRASPVHARSPRLDPPRGRASPPAPDADPGITAERGTPPARLRIPSTLLVRAHFVPGGDPRADLCWDTSPHCLPGRRPGSLARLDSARPMSADPQAPLLRVNALVKHFPARGMQRQRGAVVHAVDGVSFEIAANETLGLVGETGCGKSTVARLVTRLLEPTGGRIEFDGNEITHWSRRKLRSQRRTMQIVFQDPYSSLNPRRRVGSIVGDPLRAHRLGRRADRSARVSEVLNLVGLDPAYADRYPHQFSGGQRQRIGVARAIVTNPKLVVADEPVSALDVSIQAQVLNLFADLRQKFGLALLFISHDVSVIRHVSDRVAVMYLGKIVEVAETERLFATPAHPYTAALLAAVPLARTSGQRRVRVPVIGEPPSPLSPPSGCRFRTRCPFAQQVCADVEPPLEPRGGSLVACHFPLSPGRP